MATATQRASVVLHVLVEDPEREALERRRHRRDLREHVDAVRVLVDHALHASHLALDAGQPLAHVFLVVAVARHPTSRSRRLPFLTPLGYQLRRARASSTRRSRELGILGARMRG